MGSEDVAARDPVMPVADGFFGELVGFDGSQLREWYGHLPALPSNLDEHVVLAVIFRPHANHFDGLTFPERRDDICSDTLRPERETDFALEIVIPAHRLLFRCGIDDGFVLDAVFAKRVSARFLH